jgi:hypothetical protein
MRFAAAIGSGYGSVIPIFGVRPQATAHTFP